MNILVLLPVNNRHRAILESSAPGEDFIYTSADAATREQVAGADVILGNIDPDMLTACEHLQLLQLQTAGYDDYLAAGTVPADAKLSCSIGAYGQAVSEHMFAMVLSMMKRLPGYQDLQREHRWEDLGPVTSLKNANVLVLGAGDIGGHFATLCRSMGAHVRGIKRHPLVYPIVFEDMDGMDALPERLAEADVVASFMPSTPETRGLANAEFFAAMKPAKLYVVGSSTNLFRRFTKRRNCSTLRARRLANLPFNFKGATRRSAPFHFTAPWLKRRALADFCSTCGIFKLLERY